MDTKNLLSLKLFIDKRSNGIVQPNGGVASQNYSDFYVNIPLTKTIKKFGDYINIATDPFTTSMNRQLINPYFIELSFFETIRGISPTGQTVTYTQTQNIEDKATNYGITINS